jgi:hypothetical protein
VHGLRALGYLEGQNLVLEHRSAGGKFERFPEIIREFVSIRVDVIVSVTNAMTRAAKDERSLDRTTYRNRMVFAHGADSSASSSCF